jgi:hypothetical protein
MFAPDRGPRQTEVMISGRFIIIATVVSFALLSVAYASASAPWRTHTDAATHFVVATPSAWIWIPGTKAATLRLARDLSAQGKLHQAALVRSYATDAWQADPARIFDGIAYPATGSPIATDMVVTRHALLSGLPPTQASLKGIAGVLFDELKKSNGIKMREPSPLAVPLAGGPSFLISGSASTVGFGGRRTGFIDYVMISKHGFYYVEFRTDGAYLNRQRATFRQIANTIRLT